jgi:hypothetical protein
MRVVIICLSILFIQCAKSIKDSSNNASGQLVDLNKILETEIGPASVQQWNENKTCLLAYREKKLTEAYSTYIVLEAKTGKVLKKGTFVPGSIQWIDNYSLELLSVPGTIPQGKTLADYKKIITLNQ